MCSRLNWQLKVDTWSSRWTRPIQHIDYQHAIKWTYQQWQTVAQHQYAMKIIDHIQKQLKLSTNPTIYAYTHTNVCMHIYADLNKQFTKESNAIWTRQYTSEEWMQQNNLNSSICYAQEPRPRLVNFKCRPGSKQDRHSSRHIQHTYIHV